MDFDTLYQKAKELAGDHDIDVRMSKQRNFTGTTEEEEVTVYYILFEKEPDTLDYEETNHHRNPLDALHEFGNKLVAYHDGLMGDKIDRAHAYYDPEDFIV